MINFHPSEMQLQSFANGTLNPSLSLIVSSHCDLCRHCQQKLKEVTQVVASQSLIVSEKEESDLSVFGDMMQNIMDEPEDMNTRASEPSFLDLDGRHFPLPRSLGRFVNRTASWKKLVGKLWQAQVDIGGDVRAEFIYMEHGGSVPEHTHRGNEWTLVINGEFEDGHHHFETGDLILLDSQHTHTPVSNDPDGCLVFSIVDKPLHFTSGLARLLNPFSHLFFK
ncbi:ChrR family anti-sigma-E factor [Alteromonas sp. a30]|uniref:ChrR family anti-sigma-E factor n=1 Tax=Alteromonas sp. a30 TaxID=2730917 RepID=UPI0022813B21|nr:ChrR family anti-sigma-E factor [Alteromonas sp. a30]MCY7297109.1 anti-sigma factor [Alteromonas sp. a30]